MVVSWISGCPMEQVDDMLKLHVDRAGIRDHSDPLPLQQIQSFGQQDFQSGLHHTPSALRLAWLRIREALPCR